ncbi:MAG: aminodeoxychorismate/anthranilate synthase component II [Methanosphaera sp. SHI613]|jgi:anthranilate synthase component 2|nr:MAG: aminodeoxychorismate/anthranilate synthase component II [Methanosphaera sp. SHI613]
MILLLDNYDSFTYNLYQMLKEFEEDVVVRRNDKITTEEVRNINPSHIIISPGPGCPVNEKDFGICGNIIKEFKEIPILGVCLGNQGIYSVYGGKIKKSIPVHGKKDEITHTKSRLFEDIPERFEVVRYHSLICDEKKIPSDIKITSYTDDGIIMSIEHEKYPNYGVQFHPESIGSKYGHEIIENFLDIGGC